MSSELLFAIIGVVFGWLVFPFVLSLFAKWNKEATAKFVFEKVFKKIVSSDSKADSVSNLLSAEFVEFFALLIKEGPDSPEIEECADTILESARKIKSLSKIS